MCCTLPKVLVQVHQVQDAGFDSGWGNRKGLKRTSAQHYSHLKMAGGGSKMHMASPFPELVDTTQGASSVNVKCFSQFMSNTLSTPSSCPKLSTHFPTSNTHTHTPSTYQLDQALLTSTNIKFAASELNTHTSDTQPLAVHCGLCCCCPCVSSQLYTLGDG